MTHKDMIPGSLYTAIAEVIQQARQQVKQAVNQHMVQIWNAVRTELSRTRYGTLFRIGDPAATK